MINAVILPSGRGEAFRPLSYQMPIAMLPVVNKPIVRHQVEFLVRSGIHDIAISTDHMGDSVESYFKTGIPAGAALTFSRERHPLGSIPALQRLSDFSDGATLVVMEGDVITDMSLQAALDFHRESRADATFICPVTTSPSFQLTVALDGMSRIRVVRASSPAAARHLADGGICIIEPEILELLPHDAGYNLLQAFWLASRKVRVNMYGFQTEHPLARIVNWKTYYKVQSDVMEGRFPGVEIPGEELCPGVWVGKDSFIAPDVRFSGPVVIGDGCRVVGGVHLGKGTVVGPRAVIESGASLERSIVMEKTLVGKSSRTRDAIILGNLRIDIHRGACTTLSDTMTLDRIPARERFRLYQVLNRIFSAGILIAMLPLLLLLSIGVLLARKGPLISMTRRIGVDLQALAAGMLRLRVFDLFYFGGLVKDARSYHGGDDPPTLLPWFIARIGNLINVVRGDIMLVGNRPMDPEYAFSITEEWKRTRFKCQAGLISIVDTLENNPGDDERSITEGYYAVSRNAGMDAVVVMKAGRRVLAEVLHRVTGKHIRRLEHQSRR